MTRELKIGVCGLGSIGRGIALSLLRHGFDVHCYDPVPATMQTVVAAGAVQASSVETLARVSDVFVVAVVNEEQVRQVVLDDNAAPRKFPHRAVVVCCSTVSKEFVENLGHSLSSTGVDLLDAPVSGGTERAHRGELTVYLSGPNDAVKRTKPAFDAFATAVFRVGDAPGAGSAVKLVNQMLAAGNLAVASEAVVVAEKLGLNPEALRDIIAASAGNSWMFQNVLTGLIEPERPTRSAISIFLKDMKIAMGVCDQISLDVPVSREVVQLMSAAASADYGSKDASFLVDYLRDRT